MLVSWQLPVPESPHHIHHFGMDSWWAVLTHVVIAACPLRHQTRMCLMPFSPCSCRTIPVNPSNDALLPLSCRKPNLPGKWHPELFWSWAAEGKQSTSAIWLEEDNPEEGSGKGRHSLTLGSKATAGGLGGTFCCTSLPSLGFLFYFTGGVRGGNQTQHGIPMSSVPLFPFPPSVISVGIGFSYPAQSFVSPQTHTRLQVRPKPSAKEK